MIEFLFALLRSYYDTRVPVRYRTETEEVLDARLMNIATALDSACKSHPFDAKLGWNYASCIALAATTAKWESGLLEDVHSGKKRGPSGERCLFQIHRAVVSVPDAKYRVTAGELEQTTGTDEAATIVCVIGGVKTLGWHIHRCRIRYEDGGRYPAARVFAEYHHPYALCGAPIDGMSMARASGYQAMLHKVQTYQKERQEIAEHSR